VQTLNHILSNSIGYHHTRLPRWRSGHAVDCRSTTLRFKSGPWLPLNCIPQFGGVEESCILRPASNLKTTRGDSGHSFRETPGLIPNPAVKPRHVVYCTEVRESSGTIPSCYHLPSYTVYCSYIHSRAQPIVNISSCSYGAAQGSRPE
jgi:hypothetical protein